MKVLADEFCLDVLTWLQQSPATQKEIVRQFDVSSGTASKRLGDLEAAGLLLRRRSHGPYDIAHPRRVRALVEAAADLAAEVTRAQADAAEEHARGVRKTGLSGRSSRQQAEEQA